MTVVHQSIANEESNMGIRPRTSLVMKRKARRCPKCGTKLNNQRVRCKVCNLHQRDKR